LAATSAVFSHPKIAILAPSQTPFLPPVQTGFFI
jgi:hypothetical protein